MITLDSCSTQDVDRLLGLADQFLDGWAEDAVQGGKQDEDYEQRSTEWKAVRPLLVAAPTLLHALKEIALLCRDSVAPTAVHCSQIAQRATRGLVDDAPASQAPLEPRGTPAARLYPEAAGKIVDSIRYAEEASGWRAFEIRFADGTLLFIEPVPLVRFQVRYLRTSDGNIETLRDYGTSS